MALICHEFLSSVADPVKLMSTTSVSAARRCEVVNRAAIKSEIFFFCLSVQFNRLIVAYYLKKRWNDGAFLDLNSETVEYECEEFYKEISKIQKQFTNVIKKRKIELNTRLGEKKKARSK